VSRYISLVKALAPCLSFVIAYRWGEPFLEHTFLYHIHRLDHRHNFSPYFYSFYLSTSSHFPSVPWSSSVRHPLAAFLPQLGLSIALGFTFGAKDLAFAWLVQTLTFVAFNKVCTSQVSPSRPCSMLGALELTCLSHTVLPLVPLVPTASITKSSHLWEERHRSHCRLGPQPGGPSSFSPSESVQGRVADLTLLRSAPSFCTLLYPSPSVPLPHLTLDCLPLRRCGSRKLSNSRCSLSQSTFGFGRRGWSSLV
jgi:hypothetical protein